MLEIDEIKAKTGAFIGRYFKNHQIRDDDDIFALGFVNSLFAIQLVRFVEKQFSIVFDDADLDIKNFRSINAVAELVHVKAASSMKA